MPKGDTTRRAFLKQVSTAAAAGLLTQIPAGRLWAMAPAEFLPEPDEARLRELAQKAMDAARAAGARFADIRLTAGRCVNVTCQFQKDWFNPPGMVAPWISLPTRYGIRAIVDGAWGFAAGTDVAVDAITRAARTAVAVARGNKPRRPRTLELAPITPVANGVWATPIAQDPLNVPMAEQAELQLAAIHEAIKVKEVRSAQVTFEWRRPTNVFATTDGSLIVQRLAFAGPFGSVEASTGPSVWEYAQLSLEGLRTGGYGYEALHGQRVIPAMRELAARAVALARAAGTATSVDVGRYDIVFAAPAVAELLRLTLASALNAERALGYLTNTAGTSFAAPPNDVLGRYQVAAPGITVRADRTRAGGAATVGWDEEGVEPEAYTLIRDGVIVDYDTSRETAPQLAEWYRQRGEPVRSHGCARGCGSERPTVRAPNLTLEPGSGNATVEDLISGVKRGLYIERPDRASVDQQVINAQFNAHHTMVRLIKDGKLGGHLKHVAFQCITTPFWKSIDALGGRAASRSLPAVTHGINDPLQPFPCSTFEVVPVRARQVNVLNVGRTA